ncbi:hypothetical protein XELAEV_18027022mg [Xenopus laevis]|uniref:Uncharacterized protein n=1 Tax=Xenopus laevis TaxID=8355 RepID=A0A974CWP9_XENLA|nr:hypothetical protein XELAEV_18027022mg [Xenopus laevis]
MLKTAPCYKVWFIFDCIELRPDAQKAVIGGPPQQNSHISRFICINRGTCNCVILGGVTRREGHSVAVPPWWAAAVKTLCAIKLKPWLHNCQCLVYCFLHHVIY